MMNPATARTGEAAMITKVSFQLYVKAITNPRFRNIYENVNGVNVLSYVIA